jgi:hypothetical protein
VGLRSIKSNLKQDIPSAALHSHNQATVSLRQHRTAQSKPSLALPSLVKLQGELTGISAVPDAANDVGCAGSKVPDGCSKSNAAYRDRRRRPMDLVWLPYIADTRLPVLLEVLTLVCRFSSIQLSLTWPDRLKVMRYIVRRCAPKVGHEARVFWLNTNSWHATHWLCGCESGDRRLTGTQRELGVEPANVTGGRRSWRGVKKLAAGPADLRTGC